MGRGSMSLFCEGLGVAWGEGKIEEKPNPQNQFGTIFPKKII